jgi:hypothetical protein
MMFRDIFIGDTWIDMDRSQDTSDPNRRDLKLGLVLENIAFDLDPNMSSANYYTKHDNG